MMSAASSSRCSAARRQRGHLGRKRSRRRHRWSDSSTVDRPTALRTKQPTFTMGCSKSAMSKDGM